jgi:hypothetical protein
LSKAISNRPGSGNVVLADVCRTSESSFPRADLRALLAVLLKERERIPDRRG